MRNIHLQYSHQRLLERYAAFASHMLTLTFIENISERSARESVRYFIKRLNYKMWGRKSKKVKTRAKCQIIAIPIIEGLAGNKRTHVHLILGNIPENAVERIEEIVKDIWSGTKYSMGRMTLDQLHDVDGVAFYLAKEVGYANNDAIQWNIASIPSVLHTPPAPQSVVKARERLGSAHDVIDIESGP